MSFMGVTIAGCPPPLSASESDSPIHTFVYFLLMHMRYISPWETVRLVITRLAIVLATSGIAVSAAVRNHMIGNTLL